MTTSNGVMQHIAARTAPIAPVVMRVRSRMAGSTPRRRGISRLRRRAGKCSDVGPGIVVGNHRCLVLVRDGFEAFANNERAVGTVYVFHGQGDGFFGRQSRGSG